MKVTAVSATFENGATNSPPTANDDVAATSSDTSVAIDVLANYTDINGDPLTVQSFAQAANGTVAANLDGTLNYTPNDGFTSTDSFTYTASGGIDDAQPATVTVTVSLDDPFA